MQPLPQELIIEVLSWLPVKSLVQFTCVSKSWKSLISNSQFVKLHLHRSSSRNAGFAHTHLLIRCNFDNFGLAYVSSCSVNSLLDNHSTIEANRSCCVSRYDFRYDFIGTCNGLVCLKKIEYDDVSGNLFTLVRFWNPATKSMSRHSPPLYPIGIFGFGYDCSSDTYKVVGVRALYHETMVYVFNMGDNCWRRIQDNFPSRPNLHRGAIYVSNTLNWLASSSHIIYAEADDDTDPYMIVSFDLKKEKYAQQLSLPYCPDRRDEVYNFVPILGVLRGCLCVSQNNKKTHNFVLWQMKEFGVHNSWIQLFNISVNDKIIQWPCFTMCISENGDALLVTKFGVSPVVLYTQRDSKLKGIEITNNIICSDVQNYIESLVSPF
ncbi:F-box/kelch-repeat protein At3g23880-like [Lotus japonicus]|uniref:F-box/kelch-repeat protein At3g23880-like n=1 Tax=Lotus japonicus TaxID=34305 RepID=UPI00258CD861|nr:F-box/kelch-repeat protein At3g23880-like [Lotus japonicus]